MLLIGGGRLKKAVEKCMTKGPMDDDRGNSVNRQARWPGREGLFRSGRHSHNGCSHYRYRVVHYIKTNVRPYVP